MKKILYPVLALGAIATLASCASDEPINVKEYDGTARFSIRLPDEPATRFNDGTNAHKLYYSVFQDGKYVLDGVITDAFSNNLTQEVGIQLVANQEYQIVFFADNATSETKGYTYNPKTADFGVTYSNKMVNSDDFDAFVNTITYTATGEGTDVPLKRPFAQLNIGTNDLDNGAVEHIGLDKFSSTLTIQPTNILSGINFLSGNETAYSGEALSFSITSFASLPKDAFPVDNYKYIEMNYLLVPSTGEGQNSLIDATYVIEANGTTGNTLNLASTPVKTNYQTNVYGSLLTTQNKFNVEIKPAFDGELAPAWDGVSKKAVTPVTKTIEGVQTQVYEVNEPAELAWIAASLNDGSLDKGSYIQLTKDVDLNNKPWTPISHFSRGSEDSEKWFTGTFDGNNHTVHGLTFSNPTDDYAAGLISTVNNATVKNITVASGSLSSEDSAGAVVGVLKGESTVDNCHNTGATITAKGAAAGVVGRAYGTKNVITNCSNSGTITGEQKVGGIVGIASCTGSTTTISGCSNTGKISGGNAGTGGILGYAGTRTTVSECTNTAAIGTGDENWGGGIVGYNMASADGIAISQCTNTGEIKAKNAGGIYGAVGSYQASDIEGCTNSGVVTGVATAGGIAAVMGDGTMNNCTNTAAVTATDASAGVAGGVVGNVHRGEISACKGGAAAITATIAGRVMGTTTSGAGYNTTVNLIAEGNSYENGLRTLGSLTQYTSLATLIVNSGELIGIPDVGVNTGSRIIINEGASWDAFPGQTGTFGVNSQGQFYKVN